MYDRQKKIRVDAEWNTKLSTYLTRMVKYSGWKEENQDSKAVRSAVLRESDNVLRSPYISLKSTYFALIAGNGTLCLYRVDTLYLCSQREKLPCLISCRPDLMDRYLRLGHVTLEDLREYWLLNYFSVYTPDEDHTRIAEGTDPLGINTKYIDLQVDRGADSQLSREALSVHTDFVQYRGQRDDARLDDHLDIAIDIPTLSLDCYLVIDKDLYKQTASDELPRPNYQLRNLEGGRYERRTLSAETSKVTYQIEEYPMRYRDRATATAISSIQKQHSIFEDRLKELLEKNVVSTELDGTCQLVQEDKVSEVLKVARLPKEFYFLHLDVAHPYLGTAFSLSYNMPMKTD